jgi:hypothetical protein
MGIDRDSTIEELAATVSQALEAAGIRAILSGGAAVALFSDNEYQSYDLDFVTSAQNSIIAAALEPLGFTRTRGLREFEHPDTDYYLEFPPGPLAFGETVVHEADVPVHDTPFGPLRVVTPTQCVMDRLAAYVNWHDNQSFDQAIAVARRQPIDWGEVAHWGEREGVAGDLIASVRARANAG